MFHRAPHNGTRAVKLLVLAAVATALAACASTAVQGEADIESGSMFALSNENWPNGGARYTYPLVMIVGPPGATTCGLTEPHRSGVPWMGNVDVNRTVTVGLPSIYDRRQYRTTVRYQCSVRSPEHPEGRVVVRDVPEVRVEDSYGRTHFTRQPVIVHVGEPDAGARQRWTRLRESVTAGCRANGARGLCNMSGRAWQAMEEADLGAPAAP